MPRVWDLESGNCTQTLEGHTGSVTSVAISDDGGTVVTGSADKTVRWGCAKLCSTAVMSCGTVLSCRKARQLKLTDTELTTCQGVGP